MNIVFYSTNDVFAAEELLNSKSIDTEIEPTPVQDKAYCGVCLRVSTEDMERTVNALTNFEFQIIS